MAAEKKLQTASAPAGAAPSTADGAPSAPEQTPAQPPEGAPAGSTDLSQDEAAKLPKPPREPVYVVAPGVSISGTKAGTVEAGQEITPGHLPHATREDREARFAELVERGTIVAQ